MSPQESDIRQVFAQSLSCSGPHPGTFDVNSYKIFLRVELCQSYRIFSLSATELEYYRVIVSKIIRFPFPLKWETAIL
ncbi:hypothetical protein SDC9_119951 [bioreactor metagenome]|uniref:Uncharacterized protein n=1 Tax=bioreactor metagenome TaxID=1076179 RepID=A0A645C5Z0_9ZZZZ